MLVFSTVVVGPLATRPRGDGAPYISERFSTANRCFLRFQMWLKMGSLPYPSQLSFFAGPFLSPRTDIASFFLFGEGGEGKYYFPLPFAFCFPHLEAYPRIKR